MNKTLLVAFCLILTIHFSYGQLQTISDLTKQVIPPSPQAASLGKYGSLPVNYHTGGVTVSIPIYDVKIGSLSLPLSLTYQTSGIRVTDVASRVGLGWTLQGEGVITRTVRGLPDEDSNGWADLLGDNVTYTQVNSVTESYKVHLLELAAKGEVDSEPDMYSYNFLGHAGKFYFDQSGNVIKVPHNKLKIVPGPASFTITADDGTEYQFNKVETTTTNDQVRPLVTYNSSWYLTKIATTRNEVINLNYANAGSITYGFLLSETDYYSTNGGVKLPSRTIANQIIGSVRLSSIESRIEKLDFDYLNARQDLSGDYQLDAIRVYSKISHSYTKQFDFAFAYSNAAGSCVSVPNMTTSTHDYKRLKLLSVTEHPYGASSPKKKHSFVYNSLSLPPRCSADQDHWGFYNAKNNETLKPRMSFFPIGYVKGNRDTNPLTVGAESLTEIYYPTGGYTRFNFGVHGYNATVPRDTLLSATAQISNAAIGVYSDYNFTVGQQQLTKINIVYNYSAYDGSGAAVKLIKNGSEFFSQALNASDIPTNGGSIATSDLSLTPGNYILRVTNALGSSTGVSIQASMQYYNTIQVARTNYLGGLVLRSMEDYTEANALATKTNFLYENLQILNPVTQENYYHSYSEVTYAECGVGLGTQANYFVRSSNNNFSMATSTGSHVAYGKVTATRQGINAGKTIYEYTVDDDLGTGSNFPYPPRTSREHRRGLLKRVGHYDKNDVLVSETNNSYTFTPIDSLGAFKVGLHLDDVCSDAASAPVPNTANMSIGVYRMVGEWIKKTSQTTKNYPGPEIKTENFFYQNPIHLQVTRKEINQSNGSTAVEYFSYPDDYPDASGFIKSLKDQNMKSVVVENVKGVLEGSSTMITGGSIKTFYALYNNKPGYVSELKYLETADPIPLSQFKFSAQSMGVLPYSAGATTFAPDSRYTGNVFYDAYDAFGNLTQFHLNSDHNVSVKWGYKSSRPIAFFSNVAQNELYYQNFEEGSHDSTGIEPFMGTKFKAGYFNVSFVRPNTRAYQLSYYKYVNSKWESYSTTLTIDNPVINPGTVFDEVMIYPTDSQFKFMSYDPKTLQTQITAENLNVRQSYTYDPLQRLETIRDDNKDIVQFFRYNYKSN